MFSADYFQNSLMSAIFLGDEKSSAMLGLASDSPGLNIYRANLHATALQALSISFPTLAELVGPAMLSYVCKKLLREHPPQHGNWAQWGDKLADMLDSITELNTFPFLSDCARLDYSCHQKIRARNSLFESDSLALLSESDPDLIKVNLAPSLELIVSEYPIGEIRAAHRLQGDERAKKLKSISMNADGSQHFYACFLNNYQVNVQPLTESEYQWLERLMSLSLGEALDMVAQKEFSFEDWLAISINNNLIHHFSIM